MNKIDAVIKIGGSLSRGNALSRLCKQIEILGKSRHLLIIPGGGDFADLVRKVYTQYSLSATAAHFMAVLAMDQYGYLLSQLIPHSILIRDWLALNPDSWENKVAIMLPSEWMIHHDPLPHSWDITSDSIAAWVAAQSDCRRLILLKDVDGLWAQSDEKPGYKALISEMTLAQLSRHAGGVDPYLWRILKSSAIETWLVNGAHPERLAELLEDGRTRGTRITPDVCFS
jgi:5-(aminomethyl)-3-furanmethanol phosphate kinase